MAINQRNNDCGCEGLPPPAAFWEELRADRRAVAIVSNTSGGVGPVCDHIAARQCLNSSGARLYRVLPSLQAKHKRTSLL
jgi:hypothetical protein